MDNYDLTILVPVYNEEGNILRLEKELSLFIQNAGIRSKVLFIDDGSTDSSPELIESVCASNKSFSFIHLKENRGLSTALKAGIDEADTAWIGYIDADLQTSPGDFNSLLKHIGAYDMVTGIRMNRKDSRIKKISSSLANSIRRSVTHDGITDTGCPLKIMRSAIVKKSLFLMECTGFFPLL